jgi:hypothetical protein
VLFPHHRDETITLASDYSTRLKSINLPLRLLVENEIFRLTIWANPTNDAKRGTDYVGTTERTMQEAWILSFFTVPVLNGLQGSWANLIRTLWNIDPAIAVYFVERFKNPVARNEVVKLVRSSALDVLDIPEALAFLIGDKLDPAISRDLKVCESFGLSSTPLTVSTSISCFGHLYRLSWPIRFSSLDITVTLCCFNMHIGC